MSFQKKQLKMLFYMLQISFADHFTASVSSFCFKF